MKLWKLQIGTNQELNLIKYSRKQKEQEENIRKNKNKKGEEQR